MVDPERRTAIKKVGFAGLGVMLGYAGSNVYGHSDDGIAPTKLEASIEEQALKGNNLTGQRDWGNTHVDLPRLDATVTGTGERPSGAALYEAAIHAPLDAPFDIADFDGEIAREDVLADRLQADALMCFDGLYNAAGGRNVEARKPHEDAVATYHIRFDDPTGLASVAIPAAEAYELATGEVFDMDQQDDWDLETESFLQTYHTRFEVYSDGGQ